MPNMLQKCRRPIPHCLDTGESTSLHSGTASRSTWMFGGSESTYQGLLSSLHEAGVTVQVPVVPLCLVHLGSLSRRAGSHQSRGVGMADGSHLSVDEPATCHRQNFQRSHKAQISVWQLCLIENNKLFTMTIINCEPNLCPRMQQRWSFMKTAVSLCILLCLPSF